MERHINYFAFSPTLNRRILREEVKNLDHSGYLAKYDERLKKAVKAYISHSHKANKKLLFLSPVKRVHVLNIEKPVLNKNHPIKLKSLKKLNYFNNLYHHQNQMLIPILSQHKRPYDSKRASV